MTCCLTGRYQAIACTNVDISSAQSRGTHWKCSRYETRNILQLCTYKFTTGNNQLMSNHYNTFLSFINYIHQSQSLARYSRMFVVNSKPAWYFIFIFAVLFMISCNICSFRKTSYKYMNISVSLYTWHVKMTLISIIVFSFKSLLNVIWKATSPHHQKIHVVCMQYIPIAARKFSRILARHVLKWIIK